MDIEGYAKRALLRGQDREEIQELLAERILEIKDIPRDRALSIADAVLVESEATLELSGDVLEPTESGVTMGDFGVGSRGTGDFYAHEKIAEVIGETRAVVDSSHLDDSGVVRAGDQYVVLTVDGMHSRLSDYSFLAGFHVTRAALRDIYVMGARPVAMFSDIHVSDDGDVGKVFDHIAGITAVGDLVGVPLITGSTLRIGGDMVIGTRMTGCVGAVGITRSLTSRERAQPGDVIIVSEGAGGGTISTAALYYGYHDVVDETINVKFLEACEALIDAGLTEGIHAMTDVTNGGIRGDAKEISRTAGVRLVFEEPRMRQLVNKPVLSMLEELEIDYLGVSLDALLIIAPEEMASDIIECLEGVDVKSDIVGRVESGSGAVLVTEDGPRDFSPRFRESAYTPIKKLVGEDPDKDFEEMREKIDLAAESAARKKRRVLERLRRSADEE